MSPREEALAASGRRSRPLSRLRLDRRLAALAVLGGGVLLALAFPEPDLFFLAWCALVPLLVTLRDAGPGRAAVLGAIFGFGFFGLLLYWISIVGWVAWFVLVLLQSLFLMAFGVICALVLRSRSTVVRIAGPAVAWVAIVELARSLLPLRGFVWGELAQSQHDVPHLLRTAAFGGRWVLAFLLVVVNALLAEAVVRGSRSGGARPSVRAVAMPLVLAALLLVLPLALPGPSTAGETLRTAIVQGNVPYGVPPSYQKDLTILGSHVHLTEELPEDVDLVVWPESSVAIDIDQEPFVRRQVEAAAASAGAPMIIGANTDLPDARYRVVAFQVNEGGEIVDTYQKTHLVPFGEYVPGRRFLGWIPALEQVPRDAVPGTEATVFNVDGHPIAPVISFEADFGSLVRGRIAAGGRLLTVATNTSTWDFSWASRQHVAMSQVRAAENGVFVVHAALSGVSAFIDPAGRVLDETELWTATRAIGDVRVVDQISFYARTGDWFAWGCALLLAFWVVMSVLRGSRRKRAAREEAVGEGSPPS